MIQAAEIHAAARSREPQEDVVSIIVPVGARVDELNVLNEQYREGVRLAEVKAEFIYVLDGRDDRARESLEKIRLDYPDVTVIELARRFGEATALSVGIENSRGGTIVTLPAYFQVEPEAIGRLLSELRTSDMALAHRWPRRGGRFEHLRRRVFHGILRWVTGLKFNDLGCGARAFRREVAEEIPIYGDQHRFLPVLAAKRGFKVAEIDVEQSPKDMFRGRHRVKQYLHGILDIFTVFFIVRFTKKPLRFFGTLGSAMFAVGALIIVWLVVQRLFFDVGLGDRPALLLSSLLVVLGIQIFALGLIGELIIFTHARQIKDYTIERIEPAGDSQLTTE